MCGARIQVTIADLIGTGVVHCPECRLELTVEREASARALEDLRQLARGIRDAERLGGKPISSD